MASVTEVPVLGGREAYVPPRQATPNDHHPGAAWQASPELVGAEDLMGLFVRITQVHPGLLRLASRGLGPRAHSLLDLIMSFGSGFLTNIHLLLGRLQSPDAETGDAEQARRYRRGIALVVAHAVMGRTLEIVDGLAEEYERCSKSGGDMNGQWKFKIPQGYPQDLLDALVRALVNPNAMEQLERIVCREAADRLGELRASEGLLQEVRRHLYLFQMLATEAYEVNLSKDV